MSLFSENKDLYSTIFAALKNIGVKVPKIKNIKSSMPKHGKSTLQLDTQMFGVSLFKQEWIYTSDNPLPKFLAISTAYLVKFSSAVGLFRKSGSISRQRSLRIKLKNGEGLEGSDPNDVASLLKQWLRELPEPLIPYCLHDLFIRCQQLDGENCVTASLLSCLLLPPEHFYSLKHLLCFLKNFAKHSSDNKMDEHNLALMMAPNIFTSKIESVGKTCNNLIELHTAVIELLIENAECVGEVPLSVSLQYSNLNGKRDSKLESSAEILDSGPAKSSRKLITGPVQDLFSGIRKLVGQSTIPTSNLNILTPEASWTSPQITCRSAFKSFPLVPTQPVLLNGEEAFSTQKDKDTHVLGIKSKTNRIRRKSFGLLQRKDKKRKKSSKTNSQTKRELSISRSSDYNSEIDTDRMNKTFKVLTSSLVSEEKSPAVQCEFDESNSESIEMCSSMCNLTTPTSSLNCSQDNPYVSLFWSQFNRNVTNEPLETWQSECLYADVENDLIDSKTVSESKDLAATPNNFSELKLSDLNGKSNSNSSCDQRFITNNRISLTDTSPINPQIHNLSKIGVDKGNSNEFKIESIKLNNQRNVSSKTELNLCQTNIKKDNNYTCKSKPTIKNSLNIRNPSKEDCEDENGTLTSIKVRRKVHSTKSKSKDKNTVHQTKSIENSHNNNESCDDLHRSKSFHVDSKWKCEGKDKSSLNTKISKKATRQCSLIRGKPNSIKSGLPSKHLDKNPILKQTLEINFEKTINQKESNISFKIDPSTDISENEFFSEDEISFLLNFANLNLSSLSANNSPSRNSESFVISVPKKSPMSEKNIMNKEPLSLCLKNVPYHSDSKIPRLKQSLSTNPKLLSETSVDRKAETPNRKLSNSARPSRIPVLSKSKLYSSDCESSLNDSCFLTPDKTLFYSPNSISWMSGQKYLSIHSPQEDSFNKRDSIALILKNKSGHVLEKVQLYNSQGSKSSVSAENNSPLKQSPFRLSNHKNLSPSQSCFTTTKRTNLRSRNGTSLKLPCRLPKSSIEAETLCLNTSNSLKEVTNLDLERKQVPYHSSTPVKGDNCSQKSQTTSQQKICNTDLSKLKLKRNSFSEQTPKFSKRVSRSESSPRCSRPGNRLFRLVQESTFNRPNVPLNMSNVHNSSFSPVHTISNQRIEKSGSSLSIQKLKSDEMIDEWLCEF